MTCCVYFTTTDKKYKGACPQVQKEIIWAGIKDFTKEARKDEFGSIDWHQVQKALR